MSEYKSPITGAPLPKGQRFEKGEKQKEISSRGGKASGEARRRKKTLRDELEFLLSEVKEGANGEKHSVQYGITTALIKEALMGNTKAFEIIRDTIGEKPVDKVITAEVDQDTINEIEKMMEGGE